MIAVDREAMLSLVRRLHGVASDYPQSALPSVAGALADAVTRATTSAEAQLRTASGDAVRASDRARRAAGEALDRIVEREATVAAGLRALDVGTAG